MFERVVVIGHALRAALVPIVSIIGIFAANLIADSVLTETVFARPGLGKMLVGAIQQRDYPLIQGVVLVIALSYVMVNRVTDLSVRLLDPRLREVRP